MDLRKYLFSGVILQGVGLSLNAQTDPYVDELAYQNAWFDKAYTVMPASSPARCSMFTGRFPSATHVRTNHNVRDVHYAKDLVTVLKENHYKFRLYC